MDNFEIPIVLFTFKRLDTISPILDVIRMIKPRKFYILSDAGRNFEESLQVNEVRRLVESLIDWECTVIKDYATTNRGVFANIGLGAIRVLEKEKWAIFLEDDNLPNISFFHFCQNMLEKYEKDTRVLWICGTNYLEKYDPFDESDYVFSQLMMPCGWASWSEKFIHFYDKNFDSLQIPNFHKNFKQTIKYKPLAKQLMFSYEKSVYDIKTKGKPNSWDHNMSLTLYANNLLSIVPKVNLITNIGVDNNSIHGGSSIKHVMVNRFCEIPNHELKFPLTHPKSIMIDQKFELLSSKIITLPLRYRIKTNLVMLVKKLLKINKYEKLNSYLKNKNKTK